MNVGVRNNTVKNVQWRMHNDLERFMPHVF